MTPEAFQSRLRQTPFKPFRINTRRGGHHDILHPGMIFLTQSAIVIGVYEDDQSPTPDVIPASDARWGYSQIGSIDDL